MVKFVVEEQHKGEWLFLALVPAPSDKVAIATARRYTCKPASRKMRAHRQNVTKR